MEEELKRQYLREVIKGIFTVVVIMSVPIIVDFVVNHQPRTQTMVFRLVYLQQKGEAQINQPILLKKPVSLLLKINPSASENTIGGPEIIIKPGPLKTEQAGQSMELTVHAYDKQGIPCAEDNIEKITWTVDPLESGKVTPIEDYYMVRYQGTQKGKVYVIATIHPKQNTAPTASFIVTPTSGDTNTIFTVDASGSLDKEDKTGSLQVRWYWENDDAYDTEFSVAKKATHRYSNVGPKTIKLEVKDTGGLTSTTTRTVPVKEPEPPILSLYIAISGVPPGDSLTVEWQADLSVTWQGNQTEQGKAIQQDGVFIMPNGCSDIRLTWFRGKEKIMESGWFWPSKDINQNFGDAQRNPLPLSEVFNVKKVE